MKRWRWRAQSYRLYRWLHAINTGTPTNGTIQELQLSAGSTIFKRREGERWLCTMNAMPRCGDDVFVSLEDTGSVSIYPDSHNEVRDVICDAFGSEEPIVSAQTTDDSLVEGRSRMISSILNNGVWDSNMQDRVRPFVNLFSTALVARVLNQLSSAETAKCFFDWAGKLEGYAHNAYVYNALIMKLGMARDFDSIWNVLKRMQTEKCAATSTTFAIIIHHYGKASLFEMCFNTLVVAECKYGMKPDARMCTPLLQILFHVGKVAKAKQLIHRMQNLAIKFDMHVWFTIIHGLIKNKLLAEAEHGLNQMLSSDCVPNVRVYNALIWGCLESGDPKKALSYFDLMQTQGCKPALYTYNLLIQSYCGLRMFVEAERVVSDMKNAGCEPNHVTFNILLQHFSRNRDLKEVEDLFHKMEGSGWVSHVSYRIYSGLLRRLGEVDRLISLSDRLYSRYNHSDVEVCNAILQYYCEAGNLAKAAMYLDETFVRQSAPDEFSFALLINAYIKSGDVDAAKMLLVTMVERGFNVMTMHYELVIPVLCKHTRRSEALQLFKEMNVKGVPTTSIACGYLLEALSDAGLVEGAILVCKHIILRRHTVKGFLVVSFMKCMDKVNRLEEGKALLATMRQMGCLPLSKRFKCCVAFLLQGEISQVERYFCGLKPNIIDYTLMIQGACKKGNVNKAKAALSEMSELGFVANSSCYSKVVLCLIKSKDRAMESLELFENMLERGLAPVEAAPSYILDSICNYGEPELIMRFCKTVLSKHLKLRKTSASFLLEQDDGSELKKLYLELSESGCLVENVPGYSLQ